jgi:DNA primase
MAENLERLKQRIPLLKYLQRHNWKPCRAGSRQEFVGLCPLHQETHPSFYVNAAKNVFYCHTTGQTTWRHTMTFLWQAHCRR